MNAVYNTLTVNSIMHTQADIISRTYTTVNALRKATRNDIISLPGVGRNTWDKISTFLSSEPAQEYEHDDALELLKGLPDTVSVSDYRKAVALMSAIVDNRLVSIRYSRYGRSSSYRTIKPSHIYAYQDGTVYIKAWCGVKRRVLTFRVDRIKEYSLGREVTLPEKITIFPAVWRTRKTQAWKVAQEKLARYLGTGAWSLSPVVLVQPEGAHDPQ